MVSWFSFLKILIFQRTNRNIYESNDVSVICIKIMGMRMVEGGMREKCMGYSQKNKHKLIIFEVSDRQQRTLLWSTFVYIGNFSTIKIFTLSL